MSEREYNRFGLPSVEEQVMRECDQIDEVLWQQDFAMRTKDEGVFAL
jgi:hypothetical protein